MTLRELGPRFATATLVLCSILTAATVVKHEFFPPAQRQRGPTFEKQADWQEYANGGHRLGADQGGAVLVEFADFQCPACRALEKDIREARTKFGDRLTVVFRQLPLQIHNVAFPAALASECAAEQGRFEQMHRLLFDWADSLGRTPWSRFATEAGVQDLKVFDSCLASPGAKGRVDADMAAARKLGAKGTPTVLVNGVRFLGTLPPQSLDSLITVALKVASN